MNSYVEKSFVDVGEVSDEFEVRYKLVKDVEVKEIKKGCSCGGKKIPLVVVVNKDIIVKQSIGREKGVITRSVSLVMSDDSRQFLSYRYKVV